MNNIEELNNQACTSCQVCSAVCPADAISVKLDENGFYRPIIDKSSCIECGQCKNICYKFDDKIIMSDKCKKVFACKSNNEEDLRTCTSGGIAHVLAKKAVDKGYKVVGVIYNNETDRAETKITNKDIEQFKGSKYIQSYTEEAFKEILNNLEDDKYMVFGTPCHIYALDKAVKVIGKREQFIFVDLFCHGCPSMLVWQKKIEKIKNRLNISKFEKVDFRSKKRGWHEFCLYCDGEGKKYLTKNEFNDFYRLFFSNMVLNNACMDCKLRSTLNYTDIRLGDFWGYKYDIDKEGVSAVVAVSETGEKWISSLSEAIFIEEHTLNEVLKFQSYGLSYSIDDKLRERIFELLKSEKNIDDIVSEYTSSFGLKYKIKSLFKRATYYLPKGMRDNLRKMVHKKYNKRNEM